MPTGIYPRKDFWQYVQKTVTCWLWLGGKTDKGYGLFKSKRAHRVSYELCIGPIPTGLGLLHSCDIRHCVNPDHLTPGTQRQNIEDCIAKGRNSPPPWLGGERSRTAKLTEAVVRSIRQDNRSLSTLASEYNVSQSAISRIRLLKTWRHCA